MLASLQGITIANIWHIHYGWSPVIFEHYVIICMMRLIMRGRRRRMLMIRKFTFAWPHNQNYLTQSKKQSQPLCRNHYQCHWTLGQTLKYKLSCNGQCGNIIISLSRHFNTLHYHNHYRTITLISKTIWVVFSKDYFHPLNSKWYSTGHFGIYTFRYWSFR